MVDAGYDPRGMLGVMKVLRDASKGRKQPEILSSHPLPDTRINQIAQLIQQTYSEQQLARLTTGRPLDGGAVLAGERQDADRWGGSDARRQTPQQQRPPAPRDNRW